MKVIRPPPGTMSGTKNSLSTGEYIIVCLHMLAKQCCVTWPHWTPFQLEALGLVTVISILSPV